MIKYIHWLFALSLLVISNVAFGQVPLSATHVTDAQTQIAVTFSAVGFSTANGDYTVDGGSIAVVGVVASGTTATLLLGSVIPVGMSSVSVTYVPSGTTINSLNNRLLTCTDIKWAATNTPTPPCAPVDPITKMTFSIIPGARNSSDYSIGRVVVRARWGDPTNAFSDMSTYESNNAGVPSANTNFVTVDAALDAFNYPDNDAACDYDSRFLFGLTGVGYCAVSDPNQLITYTSHNEDNEGNGALDIEPTIANTDLVCLNDEVNMSFSDVSTLNCINDPDQPNIATRNVRVQYGDPSRADADRIPNVFVGGVQVTDDTGALLATPNGGSLGLINADGYIPVGANALGTPDAYGVVQFATPVSQLPAGALEVITTVTTPTGFANRQVGDQFHVIIEYWNICNTYDGFGDAINNNSVETFDFVQIIDVPPAPTAIDDVICEGDGLGGVNFGVGGTASSTAINWYDDDPNAGGVFTANPNGTNSTTFPASSFPGGLNTNTPGNYSMWATYVIGATNSCESDPVEITVTVREDLTVSAINYDTGIDPVCAGTNTLIFSLPVAAASEPFGGATEYVWTVTGGLSINGGNNGQSVTVDIPAGTGNGTQTVRVRRRYTSAPTCISSQRTYDIDVDAISVGGTLINGNSPICETENTGTGANILTLTGSAGTIVRWERDFNGGGFNSIGNGGNTTITQTLNNAGTYTYRVAVKNGVCAEVFSSTRAIIVNDKPVSATLSGSVSTCQGDPATLGIAIVDGTAPYTVTVDNGVGAFLWSSAADNPVVSPASTTTYSITSVVDFNNCSPATISGTPIVTITNPTDAVISGDGAICSAASTNLVVNITGGKSPYDINITDDQGSSPDLGTILNYVSGSNINTGALTTTTVYTLNSVTDDDGCPVLGISDNSATIVVGVAVSNATLNVVDVCDGAPFVFSVTITDGAPPYQIDYQIDGGGVVNEVGYVNGSDISLAAQSVANHTVDVVLVTDACGTSFGAIPQDNIEVFALPTANDQTPVVCSDAALGTTATVDLTSLEATIDGGGGNSFTWYENNGPLSGVIATPNSYVVTDGVPVYAEVDNGAVPVNCTDVAVVTYTVNPRPADPTNAIGAIACSSDATGATIAVDDPGAGNLIVWYEDGGGVTAATGATGGSNGNQFTPTSNATFTYFAINESQTAPTNCESVNALAVQHTQDLLPTAADADLDDDASLLETCTDQLLLGATAADNGGTGTWTYPGLLFYEDFNGFSDGAYQSLGTFGWSRDISATTFDGADHFDVRSNAFEGNDLDGVAVWTSATINVSAIANFNISVDAIEVGDHEVADYIELTYQIDANPEQTVGVPVTGNFTSSTISGTFATGGGTNLVIRVKMLNNSTAEFLSFDNVSLTDAAATTLTFDDIHDQNATVSGLPVATTTLTWSVASALGSCSPSTQTVDVIRNPLPIANNITPELCEDLPQGSDVVVGVDLTIVTYSDAITGIVGSTNRTIEYFDDAARMPVDAIPDPTNVDISDAEIVYIRVTDTGTSVNTMCSQDGTITFTVNTLPTTADINDASTTFCEDSFGSGTKAGINLETSYNLVVANGSLVNRNVTWYLNYNPGTGVFSNPIVIGAAAGETQNFEASDGLIIYAEVENTITNCVNVSQVDFTINQLPAANPIQVNGSPAASPANFCRSSALILFQVDDAANVGSTYLWSATTPNIEILGGTTNSFVIVRLNNDITLADNEFLQVVETAANTCPGPITQLQIVVESAPSAPSINGLTDVCANQTGVVYTVTPANPSSTYNWSIPTGASISGPTDKPTVTVNFGTSGGNIGVTESNYLGCTSPAAIPRLVTVHSRPTLDPGLDNTVCSDDPSGITFASTGVPVATHYQINSVFVTPGLLENAANVAKNGTSHSNVAAGFISGDRFRNLTGTDLAVVYTIVPTREDPATLFCDGNPVNVTLTVHPEPYLSTSLDKTTCSEEISGLEMDEQPGSVNATLFHYTLLNANGLTPGGGNATIPSTGAFPGGAAFDYIKNDTYTNTTGGPVVVSYTVVPISADGCASTSAVPVVVRLTVNSEPVGFDDALSTCSDDVLNYDLQLNVDDLGNGGNALPSDFVWVAAANANVSGESTVAQTSSNITDDLVNVTNADQIVVYTVTPTGQAANGSCLGKDFTVTVTVRPEPIGFDDALSTCSDDVLNYDLQLNVDDLGNGGNVLPSDFVWVAAANANVSGESTVAQTSSNITDDLVNVTNADQIVVYTVTPTGQAANGSCLGKDFTVTVTVRPEPVGFDDALSTCSDDVLNYDLQLNVDDLGNGGNVLPSDFVWVAAANANVSGESTVAQTSSNITDDLVNVTNADQIVVYTVTPTGQAANGSCLGKDFTVTVTVRPEPVGFDDALSTCSDDVLNYDLQLNVDDLGNGGNVLPSDFVWVAAANANVSGESTVAQTSSNITDDLVNVTNADQIVVYTVTPTGQAANGSCLGKDFTVTVTVRPEPVGFDDALSTCSDDVLNYDLQLNVDDLGNGGNVLPSDFVWVAAANANVSGESTVAQTSSNITDDLVNVTNADQIVVYTVTPTGQAANGSCLGKDFTVTVTVRPEPVGFDDALSTCSDDVLNYDLQLNVDDLGNGGNVLPSDFVWVAAANANVSGESTVAQTSSNITDDLVNVTNADQIVVYTVTPTGQAANGSCLGKDFTVTVTVRPEPVGFDDALSTCSDDVLNYDLQLNVDDLGNGGNALPSDFVWVAAANANVSGESTVAQTSSNITDDLVNVTNADQIVVYTVTPTGQAANGSCLGKDFTVTVTVRPEPIGFDDALSTCSDDVLNYDLQLNVDDLGNGGNVLPSDFVWVAAANANVSGESTVAQTSSNITDDLVNVTNADQIVVYTVTPTGQAANGSCLGKDFTVTVTVRPEPVGFDDALSTCSDDVLNYDLQLNVDDLGNGGNVLPSDFVWVAAANANVSGESTVAQTSSNITDDLVNVTNADQIVVYTVTPTGQAANGSCLGKDFTVTVTVRPEPVGFDDALSTCSDDVLNYDLQLNVDDLGNGGNVLPSDFVWVAAANANVSGESTVAQTSSNITDDLVNVTNADQIVVYTVTPTGQAANGSCLGKDFTVTVTVRPEPVGFDDALSTCSDDVLNYDLQLNVDDLGNGGNALPSDFVWVAAANANVSGESTVAQTSSNITDDLVNVTNTDQIVIYTVTPTGQAANGSCLGKDFTVTVTVHPEPVGFNDIIPVQCSNTVQYNFQTQNINNTVNGGNSLPSLFSYTVISDNLGVSPEGPRTFADKSVSPINHTYINKTGTDAIITYTVTPYALAGSNCVGDPFIVEFTIESDPVGFDEPVPIEICSDFDGSSHLIYDLQGNIDGGGNGVDSEFTYTVSGSLALESNRTLRNSNGIDFSYVNQTSSTKTITYIVTPYSDTPNGCPGDQFTLKFDILPEPVGLDQSKDVCGGVASPVNYTIQNAISNGISSVFTYDVTSSDEFAVPTPNGLNRTVASNADIADVFTNASSSSVTVTYTVTPFDDVTGCQGQDFDLDFVIIPGPAGVADAEDVCSGEQINYNIFDDNINNGGNGVAGTYKYTVSAVDPGGDLSPVPASLNRPVASTQPIMDTFINSGNTTITVTYEITPVNTLGIGCDGANFFVTFDIYPAPIGTDDLDEVLCSREATSYDLQGNINANNGLASEFMYTVSSSDLGAVPPLVGQAFAVGPISIPAGSYINTTSSAVFITYTVTPRRLGAAPINCTGETFKVRFRIDPEPVVDPSLSGPFPICSDDVTGLNLSTAGSSVGAAYYTIGINPNGLIQSAGTNSSGINKSAIEIADDAWTNTTNAPVSVFYTVTPFSSLNCEGQPFIIEVSINPEPVFDATISPTPVCSDDPLNVTLGVALTSVAATSYDVISVTPDAGLSPIVTTTGNGLAANAIINDRFINTTSNAKDVRYVVRPVNGSCKGDNFTLVITIFSAPNLDELDATVCSNELSGIILSASTGAAAAQYRIVSVTPDPALTVVTKTPDNTVTADPSEIASDQYINPTNTSLDVVYRIVPIEGGNSCNGPEETVTLTIQPEPTLVVPLNENICNEDVTSILVSSLAVPKSGNPQDVTFDVLATPIGSVTGAPFVRQNLSNGFIIEDNLRNLGNTVAEVQYSITPKILGGCPGSPTIVSVFVEPEPTGTFDQISVTICEGESIGDLDNFISTNKTPSGAGTVEYIIQSAVASDPAVTGFSTSGTLTTLAPNNELKDVINIAAGITTAQTVTYTLLPRIVGSDAGTCAGNPFTLVVNVNPRPTVTPSVTDIRICSGEIVNISLPTDVTNSIASWTVAPNTNVLGQFDGLGNSLFQSLINTTTTQQILTYTVEPFLLLDNSCTGNPVTITVTIDPVPDIVIADNQLSICSGETLNVLLDGNSANTTYDVVASSSNADISGYADFTATNGDFLNQTIVHSGTTPGTILYTITPRIDQPAPDVDPCKGLPQVIIVTVSPPVDAQIVTDDETLCIGNTKAIEFAMQGSAPFKLTLEKTDVNGVVTTEVLNNLASRHVILTTESVSYRILEVEDFYNCIVNPVDDVTITFEFAEADFTINGSKTPAPVTLDFNTGTVDVTFALSNYNPANTYTLAIGDENVTVPGPNFTYTFNKPSDFGSLGYSVVLTVKTPTAFNCNDVENIFIEVLPAQPTVIAFADILEGCPPLDVNFESFRDDLTLSKNVVVENLIWDIDGQKIRTPNPTFTFTQSGTYNVTVTGDNGHGDEAVDNLVITVFPQPEAVFSITQTVVYIPDDGFRPTNRSKGATQFSWDFGDGSVPSTVRSPEHFYEQEGEYIVTLDVMNDFGCVDFAIDTVNVEEGGFTKTPNAFTPNTNGPSGGAEYDPNVPGSGDLANDIFLPITQGITEFKMYVYDRWGNLIFFSDNKRVGWDGYNSKGQLLPSGVYIYKLDLILSNGQRTQRVGDVTLIR